MENSVVHGNKRLKRCDNKPILRQRCTKIKLSDLSEDVLGIILSKLSTKEIVRTSVLSSKWKQIWTVCPKLRLEGGTMCCKDVVGTQFSTQKFIENANAVIKQYNGKLVEELEVKFEFDSKLAEHLYVWVSFALSSGVKSLALDLLPANFPLCPDRYRFPFELCDGASISRLQQMQLSFVSFESLPQLSGFPNLKKLDLHVMRAAQIDLLNMLANCISLEWLSMVKCHLDDDLAVVRPLPRLLYLHIANCGQISKIEFSAMNLQTFVYTGRWVPIYLGHALQLKDVSLYFMDNQTLEDALVALPSVLPKVRNLSLRTLMSLEFGISADSHCSEVIRRLPRCTHNHLNSLHITGFAGCTGQVEFLVHVVENAPNLVVFTIDRADHFGGDEEYERRTRFKALDIAKRHLDGKISENTKVFIT